MAQKRPKKTATETLEDLAALGIPDGALDGELWDACESGAQLQHETIKEAVLLDQLQFLHDHGYALSRIAELVHLARDGA